MQNFTAEMIRNKSVRDKLAELTLMDVVNKGDEEDSLCLLLETFIRYLLSNKSDAANVVAKLKKNCCSEFLTPDILDLMLARA